MQPEILTNAFSFSAIACVILLALIIAISGALFSSWCPYEVNVLPPVFLAFGLCSAVLTFRIYGETFLVSDELVWHEQGILVMNSFIQDSELRLGDLTQGKEGYAWLVGMLYTVAGAAPLIPIFLNIFLFISLVPILMSTSGLIAQDLGLSDYFATRAVVFAGYFIAAVPTIGFWAPRLLREIISMFLIALSTLLVLMWLRSRAFRYLLWAIVFIVLMYTIRAQIGAGLAAGLLMGIIVVGAMKFSGVVARVTVIVPTFLGLFTLAWSYADSTRDLSVENTVYRNNALTKANSAFSGTDELQNADSVLDVIVFNLPRIFLGPFPNEFNTSGVMLLAVVSNLFWLWALLLVALLYKRTALQDLPKMADTVSSWNSVILLTTLFFAFMIMLSIGSGNYGLVIRLRLMPFVCLIPLAGIGFALKTIEKSSRPTVGNRKTVESRSCKAKSTTPG